MKRKYFMSIIIAVLIGIFVCVSAYAGGSGKCFEIKLPTAVKEAVKSMCPQGKIEEIEMDEESIKVYEVEVKKDGREIELTITKDGTIIEEEKEIDIASLPEAIRKALAGKKIEEAKHEVEYYAITFKKLDKPVVSYEVEIEEDGKDVEIEFSADGKILGREVEGDDEHGEDDDD